MEGIHVLFAVLLLVAAYQVWVSFLVLSEENIEGRRVWLQLTFIWLVPAVGAAIVHSLLATDGKPPRTPEKGFTEPPDVGA